MSFLFPVLLGGLILAGVPVLLHLIMRQKPKTLSFPAFRFLLQRQRTNLRKLQLRHLLLLAMRIALIVLLCLALGHPRLVSQGLNLTSDRPIAAILVFDTSLSMDYQTSDKLSRLDEAKKRGHEFVDQLPKESRVVILDTSEPAGSIRGDWLVTMSQAHERIEKLATRATSVSVLQTLEYAYRILGDVARTGEKGDENRHLLPRFVCIFSDRTSACWDPSKREAVHAALDQVPPSLEGLVQARDQVAPLVALLKDLRKELPPPAGADYPDQALIASLEELAPVAAALTKTDMPPEEKLRALVQNIQRRGRDLLQILQANVDKSGIKQDAGFRDKLIANMQSLLTALRGAQGLFIDVGIENPTDMAITHLELPALHTGEPRQVFGPEDKIVLRTTIQAAGSDLSSSLTCIVDGKKLRAQPADVKSGQRLTLPFEIDCNELKLAPGPHQVEVRFDSHDLLAFNNQRFVTFAIRESRRVLVIVDKPAKSQYFLKALNVPALGFAAEEVTVNKLHEIDSHAYHVVYLFEVASPSASLWKILEDFALRGVGVGIVPAGDDLDLKAYNQEAAQKVMPAELVKKVLVSKDESKFPGAIWDLGDTNILQHPLMRPFRAWKDETDVVKRPSEAFSFWKVKPHASSAVAVVNYQDEPRHPALVDGRIVQDKGAAGKVLLLTVPLDAKKPRWTNYLETRNSMYVVLIGLCTNYLAGDTDMPKLNFVAAQEEPFAKVTPNARFASYTLSGPKLVATISAPEGEIFLKLPMAEVPGNYALEAQGGKRVSAFSVNVPSKESDLSRVPPQEIENVLGPGAVIPVDRKANIGELLQGHWSEPLELFPLLMLMLLVVLALENLLANRFYRSES